MSRIRPLIGVAAVLASLFLPIASASAQAVTTGGITGTIVDADGKPVESAQVQLRNPLTGYNVGAVSRSNGNFLIQGVEPNSNYRITIRRIGYAPMTRDGIVITLGQTRREDFRMIREVAQLGEVSITASAVDAVINASKTGTSTTLTDSMLHRLPSLQRNFADFVQLVPQVSTTTGFLSGGGVNLRQNAIQIDGATASDPFGLGTTGQPGSSANAKSIPLDAVKEYQVLLSPFDVRQGNFGGLLINAVTRSGTNEWHGTGYTDTRTQNFSRTAPFNTQFSQQHYSGSFGGPLIKDKLFVFASGELQHKQFPAAGSYVGAPDAYVTQPVVDGINAAAAAYGLLAGSGDQIQKENPNRNGFIRFDAYLPGNTRLVVRDNYASADNTTFSRSDPSNASPLFTLTSNKYDLSNKSNSAVAELLTNFSSGTYNEMLFNYSTISDFRTVPVKFPQLTIKGVPRTDDPTKTTSFVMGTEASSQGNSLDQRTVELTDNVTMPFGAHAVTVGGKGLWYRSINLFGQNSLGSWTFSTLANFQAGIASTYVVSAPAPTDPNNGLATINSSTYIGYVEDNWQATPTLSLNFGARFDKPVFGTTPPDNASVSAIYGRNTSSVPSETQFSPRFGFNWDVTGDQKNQLRGGAGSFTGPPPFVYLSNAYGNSGLSGFAALTCSGSTSGTTSLAVPAFNAQTIATPPTACAAAAGKPGATLALGAAVNTIDPEFKMPKYFKATVGYDHRFLNGFIGTLEGLFTRSQNNAFYQNLALFDSTTKTLISSGTDAHGRVLYGTAFSTTGASPKTYGGRTAVLDLTNSSGDYTYSITAQAQKSFSDHFEGSLAYTHQKSMDVVSVTSSTAGSNYRYQRDVAGSLADMSVTTSKYDQPHRIVATGTYRFPTATDLSFIYQGNSGAPFDFVYGSNGGTTGDLNADGQSQNDLMYIPTNATNQSELLFSGYNGTTAQQATAASQAAAFESFIANTPCLNSQRGKIMTRNSCRNPWVNEVDLSMAQSLGKLGPKTLQNLELRLDIINFGNLLNKNWGQQAFSDQGSTCGQICSATVALTHVGFAAPAGSTLSGANAIPIVTYNTSYTAFNSNNLSSLYTMQLSVRYSF
jgi:Carboxypeptidase regulatory-like domain